MTHIVLANKHFLGLAGGAERNISDLANWLWRNGYEVTIASETKHGTEPCFPLDPGICIAMPNRYSSDSCGPDPVALRLPNEPDARAWLKESYTMRRKWSDCMSTLRPDVIVTFMPHTQTFLLQELASKYPILVSNQNDPDVDYYSDKHGSNPFEKKLRLESLKLAGAIHFLLPDFVGKMPEFVQRKSVVIPNAVPVQTRHRLIPPRTNKRIIAVGRLVAQKGFDVLIDAFDRAQVRHFGWQLHIYGEGPDEAKLKEQIRRKRLQRHVLLRGFTSDPIGEMLQADIFVIPSLYEGWGLTLTEAMSVGLPTIGFADCSGVNWLIRNGENGLLVNRASEHLAGALERLVEDSSLCQKLGSGARSFVQQFAPEAVYPQWARLINSLILRSEHNARERNNDRDSRLQRAPDSGASPR